MSHGNEQLVKETAKKIVEWQELSEDKESMMKEQSCAPSPGSKLVHANSKVGVTWPRSQASVTSANSSDW